MLMNALAVAHQYAHGDCDMRILEQLTIDLDSTSAGRSSKPLGSLEAIVDAGGEGISELSVEIVMRPALMAFSAW